MSGITSRISTIFAQNSVGLGQYWCLIRAETCQSDSIMLLSFQISKEQFDKAFDVSWVIIGCGLTRYFSILFAFVKSNVVVHSEAASNLSSVVCHCCDVTGSWIQADSVSVKIHVWTVSWHTTLGDRKTNTFCQCFQSTASGIRNLLAGVQNSGARFSKNLIMNLRKTYEKVWLMKNLGWACDYKKSYKNFVKILGGTYAKLMKNLRRHYRYLTET